MMIDTISLQHILTQDWFQFVFVGLLGFLTGLELREYITSKENHFKIGSSRTYTFLAILGYVLAAVDPQYRLYLGAMLVLASWFALFYYRKLAAGQHGILQLLIALIVYSYGPVLQHFPPWFLLLLFVSVVFTLNAKPLAHRIVEGLERNELLTLAKFLLLAGVILPLLPDTTISPYVPASPFRIWLGVVVISGISYIGYILKRYLFQRQGYLVTGLVGGLYSSTATTVVLARKSKEASLVSDQLVAAVLAASAMMYLRLLLLVAVLQPALLPLSAMPLLTLGTILFIVAVRLARRETAAAAQPPQDHGGANPLELGVAFMFAMLFVVMLAVTHAVIEYFGKNGLEFLSVVIGFTDIDPFVLSILNGDYKLVGLESLAGAVLIAAGANNVLKGLYALALGERRSGVKLLVALSLAGVITAAYGFILARGGLSG
ncbi:MAG: DUF4010 domain-containing protein [Gammaproteobacteria bacterium]|jgi:uncharacterized membrane protein (DUF4010 family)